MKPLNTQFRKETPEINKFINHINIKKDAINNYHLNRDCLTSIKDFIHKIFGLFKPSGAYTAYQRLLNKSINVEFSTYDLYTAMDRIYFDHKTLPNSKIVKTYFEDTITKIKSVVSKEECFGHFYKCTKGNQDIYLYGTNHVAPKTTWKKAVKQFASVVPHNTVIRAELDIDKDPTISESDRIILKKTLDYQLCLDKDTKVPKKVMPFETLAYQQTLEFPNLVNIVQKKTQFLQKKGLVKNRTWDNMRVGSYAIKQAFLNSTFVLFDWLKGTNRHMMDSWSNSTESASLLLDDRNEKWVCKLASENAIDQKVACVIGFLHLYGNKGLLNLLTKQGYEISKVGSK